ncbi:MAG: helix-turn-helix domain-containing protein [Myxococcales bacterium]
MNSTLKSRLSSPGLKLEIKQFRIVVDFLTAIEEELISNGKSQADLARLLGAERAWVSKLFSSKKRGLTFFTAVKLADALGMDIDVQIAKRPGARVESENPQPLAISVSNLKMDTQQSILAANDNLELAA